MSDCDKIVSEPSVLGFEKPDNLVKPQKELKSLSVSSQAAADERGATAQAVDPVQLSDEKIVSLGAGAFLQGGRDRPAEAGTGNKGPNNPCIYICTGPSGRLINKSPADKSGTKVKVNRNFNLDDSFIYLSGRADIDKYLGLARGKMGNSVDSPAIAIKSSDLRFVARNGIKLVTGVDARNEKGAPKASIVGIELIAGNDDKNLQPIIKGNNLVDAFNEFNSKVIEKMIATIEKLAAHQNEFNIALTRHQHPDLLNMIVGLLAEHNLKAVSQGKTIKSWPVYIEGQKTTQFIAGDVLTSLTNLRNNVNKFKSDYLTKPGAGKDIRSGYNKVN